MILLGTAKCPITPSEPMRLCGYASRTENFDTVAEDIFLRIHYWEFGCCTLVLVYGDLIWWNPDFVKDIRTVAKRDLQLSPESLVFIASHNHSGPGTGNSFIPLLETSTPGYTVFLTNKIIEAIRTAKSNKESVTIKRFDGSCRMNVYRRTATKNGIQMLPNYAVPADPDLTILGFYREDKTPKGFAIHYACHANLSDGNAVHPDYPGMVLRAFDKTYSDSISIFHQGCTADLRPNSVLGMRFVSCPYDRVRQFAEQFFKICKTILDSPGKTIEGTLEISRQTMRLPLDQSFSHEGIVSLATQENDGDSETQWAKKILEKNLRPYEILEICKVNLGSIPMFFFNAEMVQSYAIFAREHLPGALCTCYANGMIGYICDARQIAEGGYEPCESTKYFALAGTYDQKIESMIHATMLHMENQQQYIEVKK